MRVYSFANTVMIINGVEITGFSEGDDVIDITRNGDSASHKVGADGHMVVSLSADKSGAYKFKLQSTSSSNRYLSMLAAQQDGGTATFVPLHVKFQDLHRQDLADGSVGYLKKHADIKTGKEAGEREWEVIVESLDMLLGDQSDLA